MDLKIYRGYRFFAKSLRTSESFWGWVAETEVNDLQLDLLGQTEAAKGDRLAFSITIPTGTFQFLVRVTERDGQTLRCSIDSRITLVDSKQTARRRKRMELPIQIDGEAVMGELCDISEGGIGLETFQPLPTGTRLEFSLETEDGPLAAAGHVTYSGPSSSEGSFRIGVSLEKMDRLTWARWQVLLQDGERVTVTRTRSA
ncbi:MAG: PilZ domain-containing protein [Chthonomonas sp.]|nr:PilZ domain-containing protein [Chthonomonas sp.]